MFWKNLQGGEVRDPGAHFDLKENSNALVPVNHTWHAMEVIRHTWDWWQEMRWLGSGRIHTHYPGSGNKTARGSATEWLPSLSRTSGGVCGRHLCWYPLRHCSPCDSTETEHKQQKRWKLLTHLTQQAAESYPLLYNMFYNMISWSI